MKVRITPTKLKGEIQAIPSKSMAHRLLICAAMTEGTTRVRCNTSSEDIDATVSCLRAMGSNVVRIGNTYLVPKVTVHAGQTVEFDCGESGTTLRFMMCVAAGLGLCARFKGSDRLFERPLSPLAEILTDHGIVISRDKSNRIIQSGRAFPGEYKIQGDVSSQFISGLLLMLPLCGGGSVEVTGLFESKPYVGLTVAAMLESDVKVECNDRIYKVFGRYDLRDCAVEGDWSNSAFWLCAGAMGSDVTVFDLDAESLQGDRAVTQVLEHFGAEISCDKTRFTCKSDGLTACVVDASDIPDLVPVLSVVAAVSKGETRITGCSRLRLKESDRLLTVSQMINNLGGSAEVSDDTLIIRGAKLTGGEVQSCRDHRIAMAAAIASTCCEGEVIITGAEAVCKSYPAFFEDMKTLGANLEVEE